MKKSEEYCWHVTKLFICLTCVKILLKQNFTRFPLVLKIYNSNQLTRLNLVTSFIIDKSLLLWYTHSYHYCCRSWWLDHPLLDILLRFFNHWTAIMMGYSVEEYLLESPDTSTYSRVTPGTNSMCLPWFSAKWKRPEDTNTNLQL